MRFEATIEPESLQTIWHVLKEYGVSNASLDNEAVWFHTPRFVQGLATEFCCRLPNDNLELRMSRSRAASKLNSPAGMLTLSIEAPPEQADVARDCMAGLVSAFEHARRRECRSAEHFLGDLEFTWHEMGYPRMFLPTLLSNLQARLEGWKLLKVVGPRRGKVQKSLMLDAQGKRESVYTNARFYYHREDAWLVAEVNTSVGLTVSLASAGTASGWADELLEHLEETLTSGHIVSSRKMTPDGEELKLDREYAWDDLFLGAEIKARLQQEISEFFDRKEMYEKMDLPHRRGLLLHGAPGTGKTLLGKILASTIDDVVFVWITAADVRSPECVSALFQLARRCRRVILFFEDLDMYASKRTYDHASLPLGELLVQLDGMHSNDGILVIATTNDLDAIEPALKDRPSRFDRVIEFELASEPVRFAHLRHLLGKYGVEAGPLEAMARRSEGFTGAQLQELAFRARLSAANRDGGQIDARDLEAAFEDARKYKATPVGFAVTERRGSHRYDDVFD